MKEIQIQKHIHLMLDLVINYNLKVDLVLILKIDFQVMNLEIYIIKHNKMKINRLENYKESQNYKNQY
jgi:hypothetical protein